MLKYQLKKDVKIEIGMAFRYKSNEELEALISALGLPDDISSDAIRSSSSLKHSGLLIFSLESPSFSNENKLQKRFIIRKYLVERDERVVKKKDFFDKTEYDNGPKNNKGHISKIEIANANQISGDDVSSKSIIAKEIVDLARKTLKNVDIKGIVIQPPFGCLIRDENKNVFFEETRHDDIKGVVQVFEYPIVGKKYITIYIPNKGETSISSYVAATFKISNNKLKLVCESVENITNQEHNDDVALNMSLYYGCKLLPETSLPHILPHARQLGLYDRLQEPPKLALGMYVKEQPNRYEKGVYLFTQITNKTNIILPEIFAHFEYFDSARLAQEVVYFDSKKVTHYTSMLVLLGLYYKEMSLRKLIDLSDPCPNNTEGTNKPFVAYAITDGCGFRVPLETCKDGVLTGTHRQKGVFMKGAEQDPFADKLYIVGMETDRIKKLVASKFPLFKVMGVYNIGTLRPSVHVKIPNIGCECKLTLQGDTIVGIDYDFKDGDDRLVSTDVLKVFISSYFGYEKQNRSLVRKINLEGLGDVLLVNKKTFNGSGGPQGFFDMLYKLKTIVVDSDEQLTDSINKEARFENGTSLDGKQVLIYIRKDGSKVIIE